MRINVFNINYIFPMIFRFFDFSTLYIFSYMFQGILLLPVLLIYDIVSFHVLFISQLYSFDNYFETDIAGQSNQRSYTIYNTDYVNGMQALIVCAIQKIRRYIYASMILSSGGLSRKMSTDRYYTLLYNIQPQSQTHLPDPTHVQTLTYYFHSEFWFIIFIYIFLSYGLRHIPFCLFITIFSKYFSK